MSLKFYPNPSILRVINQIRPSSPLCACLIRLSLSSHSLSRSPVLSLSYTRRCCGIKVTARANCKSFVRQRCQRTHGKREQNEITQIH